MKPEIVFHTLGKEGELTPIPDLITHKNKPKLMDKNTFDYYFIELNYNRKEMGVIGLGSKSFERTYKYHYPNRLDRARLGGSKIAISQKRVNSNINNTGKLKKEIPFEALKDDVTSGKTYAYMCLKYKMCEPTLVANLKHHNLLDTYREVGVLKSVNIDAYKSLERLLNRSIVVELRSFNKDMSYINSFIVEAERQLRKCKDVTQYLRGLYNLGPTMSPNSKFERYAMEFLDSKGIDYVPQYRAGSFVYDIYIPKINLAVECDGFLHTEEADTKKDAFAASIGLNVIRLDFSAIKNSKKKCLQQIELCLSPRLV